MALEQGLEPLADPAAMGLRDKTDVALQISGGRKSYSAKDAGTNSCSDGGDEI